MKKFLISSLLFLAPISSAFAFTTDAQDIDNNLSVTYSDNIKDVNQYLNQRLSLIVINNRIEPYLIDNVAIIMTNQIQPQPSYNNKVQIRTSTDYTIPFKKCFLTCKVLISFDYKEPIEYRFFSGNERSSYVLDPSDNKNFSENLQKSKTVSVQINSKLDENLVYRFNTSEINYKKLKHNNGNN